MYVMYVVSRLLVCVYIHSCMCTYIHEGRDEAMASRGQIFGGEIEVLKEYNLWLFLGL